MQPTTHHPSGGEQGEEEHHHHQYNTRFQEHWEMEHPGNGEQQQQQSDSAIDGEEHAVVYEVHYSEEHQRDYYVHPATKKVSWFAPNVSIPSNGLDNGMEVPYSPRYQRKEPPAKDSGRLAILAALAFCALGLHLWAKLWLPDEILSKVPSPLPVVTLTAIKPIVGKIAETVPSPQTTTSSVSEEAPPETASSPETKESADETPEEEVSESESEPTMDTEDAIPAEPNHTSVEEPVDAETETTIPTPSDVKEEEPEKMAEDPRKMAEAVAKAMVNSFASKGDDEACADDSQWERNVVLPAELNPLEASFDEQVNSILERIQSQMNENERRHYIKEVSKSDNNLCKFPLSHKVFPHCKEFKWDSELEKNKPATYPVAVVTDEENPSMD